MRIEDTIKIAKRAVLEHKLCDSCLGRLFGMLGYNLSNAERGWTLKALLLMEAYNNLRVETDTVMLTALAASGFKPAEAALKKLGLTKIEEAYCYLCEGLVSRLSELSMMCVKAGEEYEYETFQVGCNIPKNLLEREEKLWLNLGLASSESIRSEITREIGKRIEGLAGKKYSLKDPDIIFLVDVEKWRVTVIPRPIYIYGRYRKLVRGLPQSPWLYQPDSRVLYPTSIEELITKPLVRITSAKEAKLHAAGREDLDVRTLGSGRPFVVEIRSPKIRRINLEEVQRMINEEAEGLVEIEDLKYVDRRIVPKLKAYAEIARKTYIARVKLGREVSESDLRGLEKAFRGAIIQQRTPSRVLGRRIDKVRKKVVHEVKAKALEPRLLEMEITCQGGLYVKELIHGDEGRTRPSVAEILGTSVEVESLDVVWIEEPAIIRSFIR